MYDQSFSAHTLARMLRKSDYIRYPELGSYRKTQSLIASAVAKASSLLSGVNFLTRSQLGSKFLYQPTAADDMLIVRKITANLLHASQCRTPNRNHIVSTLRHFLSEGVPYQIYRLDVFNFYESFDSANVASRITTLNGVSSLTKKLVNSLFAYYATIGGQGIPRGLPLSAALAEIMMQDFDQFTAGLETVVLYSRYVDDIVLVTHSPVQRRVLVKSLKERLPQGLSLHNEKRTVCVAELLPKLQPVKVERFQFDFLGYKFLIYDPAKPSGNVRTNHMFRDVSIEIARQKIKKIKTRIVRSFLAFTVDSDFSLLADRIKFLTSNMKIKDFDRNISKLSGIYQNYSLLGAESQSLKALDYFLRAALFSSKERAFLRARAMLSRQQKYALYRFSFVRGHRQKVFFHFSRPRLLKIAKCWPYA
jgi:hypothetical protein